VVPIPGTKRRAYLEDNVGAVAVELTPDDLARLGTLDAAGARYAETTWTNLSTPAPAARA
jgi:aryl-alcohol dehydrogenase-like predicted oxidoreductase